MHPTILTRSEDFLRYSVGLILWGISALLTISLFLSIAGDNLGNRIIMIVLALALEGAKILTWRMGGRARFLAFMLIALSAFASFGAALQTVENAKASFLSNSSVETKKSDAYQALSKERESIDVEISISIDRIAKLPPDYTTAAKNLILSLQVLRARRARILDAMAAIEKAHVQGYADSNMFILLGRTVGQPPENVLLVLLLFLAASIEAGALLLTAPGRPATGLGEASKEETTPGDGEMLHDESYQCPIGPAEFLEAASEGADLPYLHGRDTTARKLGIGSYKAKSLLKELIKNGSVAVEGKRLKLMGAEDHTKEEE